MLPAVLKLYRAFHPVGTDTPPPQRPARPEGRLVWLHAPTAAAARGFGPLVQGLWDEGLTDTSLITCPEPLEIPGATVVPPPADRAEDVAAFLAHWHPSLGIWSGGDLRPLLLDHAARQSLPMLLVDGQMPQLPGARWWPGLVRNTLAAFDAALVLDAESAQRFARSGLRPDQIQVTGPLEEPSHILPVNEAERAALARGFGTRPVWLAASIPQSEDDVVATAHLSALRMAHRLLLILVPDTPARVPDLAQRLQRLHGLSVAVRSRDEDPDEDIQVYIADTEGELGLWYRLAPLTFCGGSSSPGGALRHPFEAAAAGSALIHGLEPGAHAEAFGRIRSAGASRVIPSAGDLGEAVGDLLAADRCARLAGKAWEVASSGVEATARALELARTLLEGPDP